MNRFLDTLRQRVLVFDGAMGTNLQLRDLSIDDFGGPRLEGCPEVLVLNRPEVVSEIHAAFLEVGCDAVETDTFGAHPDVLAEYGLAEHSYELNRRAARLAREVASDFATSDRPRWVVGAIGPGTKSPSLGQIAFIALRDGYQLQAEGLLDGGADVLLVETVYDLLQAKAALIACRRAMTKSSRSVPLMVQVTIESSGRLLLGTEIGAALTSLEALAPDVIGLNCATGPWEMTEHLTHLSRHGRAALSCLPNAGLPSVVDGRTHYDLSPDGLASAHDRFVSELGVSIVGGCCGTTPEHLRRVVETTWGREPVAREPRREPGCASLYAHVPFAQESSFLVVGERANASGSRRFGEALAAEDWEGCVRVAKDQAKEGAHVLDLSVDYVGRDGVGDMGEIARRLATAATLPLVLDSTEPAVLEAGLQHLGGKALLNSANLEDGEAPGSRCDRVFSLAKEYGAAVVCLAIDEEGQARTAEAKLRVARRLYRLATERYGLDPADLLFDPLTFPLGSGQEELRTDAMETLRAIRSIKSELAGSATIMGISNVSFGLAPPVRQVLNSVFLHECRAAGLDAAILHPGRILPLHLIDDEVRQLALDVIYDRRQPGYDPLLEFMTRFSQDERTPLRKEDRSSWSVEERLKARIVDGDRQGLEADLEEAMSVRPALAIVNEILLPGMRAVGDLFAAGRMQLPFVLQSAETMKAAVAHLEPRMERSAGRARGRVVLGTVRGDVHDIGKNLVDILLTNNGFEVFNLGIKVPVTAFVEKAVEVGADAIGMSGLLVKSTLIMRENLEELNARGLHHIPVLLGGAALTRRYVENELQDIYKGQVSYGKDAFEALDLVRALVGGEPAASDPASVNGHQQRGSGRRRVPRLPRGDSAAGRVPRGPVVTLAEPEVSTGNPVFSPPFLGCRVAKGVALQDIAGFLNETALFRNQWQFRPQGGESDQAFRVRLRSILREELDQAHRLGSLNPAVAWGYFPVNGEGNDLVVWTDDDRRGERMRFHFPRQPEGRRLCIADFFRSTDSGEADYAAFHVVTVGPEASAHARALFEANQYRDYLFCHGLSVEMAEALAEYWHRRIREEWGFVAEDGPSVAGLFRQRYRGSRYSWGYPACPDLEEQHKVAQLLEIHRIGVEVSEECQLQPEQSTSAIIVHHPEAKYFIA